MGQSARLSDRRKSSAMERPSRQFAAGPQQDCKGRSITPLCPTIRWPNSSMLCVDRMALRPLALEFAILTAARTGEIIGARWNEIDLAANVWTVPASRMKGGREHRVPLSADALAALDKMSKGDPEDFVFAGRKKRPLSNMALLMLLRRMGHINLTVAWLSVDVPRLGCRADEFSGRSSRSSLGHVGRRQSRSCLSARRFFRETSAPHGGVGAICDDRARCRRSSNAGNR